MPGKRVLVVHGCNLSLLGEREPDIYGHATLDEIDRQIESLAGELGVEVRIVQSNHEGGIIDSIQDARDWADGIVINPAGFTTTSVGILDAIKATGLPAVEVHLSNIHAREEFRRRSVIAPGTIGQICGFGADSYLLALRGLSRQLAARGPK
jgi:3-dehydroquinate dehydratase-2